MNAMWKVIVVALAAYSISVTKHLVSLSETVFYNASNRNLRKLLGHDDDLAGIDTAMWLLGGVIVIAILIECGRAVRASRPPPP